MKIGHRLSHSTVLNLNLILTVESRLPQTVTSTMHDKRCGVLLIMKDHLVLNALGLLYECSTQTVLDTHPAVCHYPACQGSRRKSGLVLNHKRPSQDKNICYGPKLQVSELTYVRQNNVWAQTFSFQEPDEGLMLPWDKQNLDNADLLNSCFSTTGRNPTNLILIEFCTVGLSENEPLCDYLDYLHFIESQNSRSFQECILQLFLFTHLVNKVVCFLALKTEKTDLETGTCRKLEAQYCCHLAHFSFAIYLKHQL